MAVLQRVSGQGGPGKDTNQDRSSAGDGLVRPLVLGLHAQMGPHLLEINFQLPAQHKPSQDLGRVRRRVGTEQSLRGEGAPGVRPAYSVLIPLLNYAQSLEKMREEGRIVNVSVAVATAVNAEAWREIVERGVGTSEDGAFWLAFLRSLSARG